MFFVESAMPIYIMYSSGYTLVNVVFTEENKWSCEDKYILAPTTILATITFYLPHDPTPK